MTPDPLPLHSLEHLYGPPVEPRLPGSVDEEWREASLLASALWLAGAVDWVDPAVVAKVKLALRYTRHRLSDDPVLAVWVENVEEDV